MIFYRVKFYCQGQDLRVDMVLDPSMVKDILSVNVCYMLRHAIRAKKVSENMYKKPHHILSTELSLDRIDWFAVDLGLGED